MATEKDNGGPAFPQPATAEGDATNTLEGMWLRDYFAGQALAGMMADPSIHFSADQFAKSAYLYADAMLAERAK